MKVKWIVAFMGCSIAMAQIPEVKLDSLPIVLNEIEMTVNAQKKLETELKMAVSVDEYLASSEQISFIKRGAFAWEPLLNNMNTERSSITIDGMHIFGACTDKMDPVTSYVETNNLSGIDIKSGQEGGINGSTLAGNIDLKKKATAFGVNNLWSVGYQTGVEWNNKQLYNLGNVSFSSNKFAVDASIAYRKAENYYDGKNKEVKNSQYSKFNSSVGLAYKTSELSSVRVDAIFDQANNVGFPALPMDLWLSRAIITSVAYKQLFTESTVKAWDTKLYYNAIEHYMDDTTRPENKVHMDMPGWSTTYGLLSKIDFKKNNYSADIQLNAYNNLSIAEMKMYPQDRNERTMFAYTWPWVTTSYVGLSTNNVFELNDNSEVRLGGSLAMNYNYSKYIEFNRIFYPDASQSKTRVLPSFFANYQAAIKDFSFGVGVGYGHRAPLVSEGYGYYIYNSYDRYDYVGNPDLKNEISYEFNASAKYTKPRWTAQAKANFFYIENYIVGKVLSIGSPMNYQSVGVKGYTSLDYATLFNFSLNATYDILTHLHWKGGLTYARAVDNRHVNLPFIRPLSYQTALHYMYNAWSFQTSVYGDFKHQDFSPIYGEYPTAAYAVWNASVDYTFYIKNIKVVAQVGAENLLNEYYSTYADWGNIPRMGRNIFTSLKINF